MYRCFFGPQTWTNPTKSSVKPFHTVDVLSNLKLELHTKQGQRISHMLPDVVEYEVKMEFNAWEYSIIPNYGKEK